MSNYPDNFRTLFPDSEPPPPPARPAPPPKAAPPAYATPPDAHTPPTSAFTGTQAHVPAARLSETAPQVAMDKTSAAGPSMQQTFRGIPQAQSVLDADDLKKRLIDRRLISKADWEAAVKQVGVGASVPIILQTLERTPATWSVAGGESFTALTAFQVKQIAAGHLDRLRLQHYVILDRIGAGGMGEVFKARNLNLPRLEAIKTILRECAPGGTSGNNQAVERFQREAAVLAQLNHRYITTVHHAGWENDIAFIAMEYVRGQDMKKIVEQAKSEGDLVPVWWACERIIASAEALHHAHEHGVVHRDIKPGNIMITDNDELKVLDMGIARLLTTDGGGTPGAALTQNSVGLGTPEVMPPEQWADATSVTAASDIYSLGCTLYYILTGQMPFVADSLNDLMFAHLSDPPPDASRFRKDVPKALDAVVAKMLAKDPKDRYATGEAVAEALFQFTEKGQNASRRRSGSGMSTVLIGTVVGAALAVGGIMLAPKFLSPATEDGPGVVNGDPKTEPTPIARNPAEEAEKFLAATQAEHKEVWPSRGKLDTFLDQQTEIPRSVSTIADLENLKKGLQAATKAREDSLIAVRDWLRDYQRKNPKIWTSVPMIEGFAFKEVPPEDTYRAIAVDKLKRLVDEETVNRRAAQLEAALEQELPLYQKQNVDVWPDIVRLHEFVERRLVTVSNSDDGLKAMMKEVDKETWSRRCEPWLEEFQGKNSAAWPNVGSLYDFVKGSMSEEVADKTSFEKMTASVRNETQKRIQTRANDWLAEYQAKNASFWPSLGALKADAAADGVNLTVMDEPGLQKMRQGVEGVVQKFQRPFSGMKPPATGNVKSDFVAASALYIEEWLLKLTAVPTQPESALAVKTTFEGKATTSVPVNKNLTVNVRCTFSGYVTAVIFGSDGTRFILQSKMPLPAGTDVDLFQMGASEPGQDRLVLYVSDANPLDNAPRPPEGWEKSKSFKGFWAGFRMPPLQLTADEVGRLKSSFRSKAIADKVDLLVRDGGAYPGLSPDPNVKNWCRKTIDVRITP